MPQQPWKRCSRRSATRSHRADTSLRGIKRDRGIHTAEFGSRDMVYLLALRSLNRYIPQLFHLSESTGHPWTVYGLLRQLIGELSSFSEQFTVSGDTVDGSSELPKY